MVHHLHMDGRSRTFQGAPGASHALCFVYVGIDPVLDGNGFFRAYRRTAAASHTFPPVDPGFAFDRHKRFPLCFDWIQNTTAYHGGSVTMSHKRWIKRKPRKTFAFRGLGAIGRTRTGDLLITNQLLYQLSHSSICFNILSILSSSVKR